MIGRRSLSRETLAGALLLALCIFSGGWAQQPQPAMPRVNVGSGSGPAYVSDTWGGLQLQLTNPRDRAADLLCLTYLDDDKALQFGRRVWVPPHARLKVWQPIRLPPAGGASKLASVDYHTLLSEVGSTAEVLIPDSGDRLVRDGALPLGTRGKVTGFIVTRELTADGDVPSDTVSEFVLAARGQSALSLRTSYFYETPLPFYGPESLEALDCLVIADSRILAEPVALASVRRWLYTGGRVWVLLDQVDPQVLEALVGDEFGCHVVDRVGLTQVKIASGEHGAPVPDEVAEYEQPVELVRVVASDLDVMYTVEDWPAALLKRFGDGQLLVTTLAPDGWLRHARPRDRTLPAAMAAALAGPPPTQGREGVVPLRNLGADFFSEPLPPLLPPEKLEPVVREYIGYRIPPAGIVVGLLGVFNLLIIGAGLALWRLGRLDRIGFVIPVAALAIGGLLVSVGQAYRQGVTPTVARLQVVQAIPGTDDQRAWGVAGLSSPSTLPAEITSSHGGWSELKLPQGAAATRRMVWTDHETWRWENLRQPAGLQFAAYESSTTAAPRVEAAATLSAAGLTGKLRLAGEQQVEDCMVVTREGRISAQVQSDGTFLAPASGVMSHGQFLSAGLLSDEQNRRQRVLAELLSENRRADFPDRPHLFFWTSHWDSGIDFGKQLHPVGSTLVAVPLGLARPAAGTEVVIPAPLIAFRAVGGPDGTAAGGMYDNRQHQWLERSRPSQVWLEFAIPSVLLPLETTAARVVFEVNGPVKQLEVAAFDQGQVVPLATWKNPVGTLAADLADRQHLVLRPNGTLLFRVAAGGPASGQFDPTVNAEGRASYWRIESLRLELRGRVLADDDSSRSTSSQPSR